MPYIIAEPCGPVKNRGCIRVCPVRCIFEGVYEAPDGRRYDQMYIHPKECIDCGLCVDECPAHAIFHHARLPAEWAHYRQVNRDAVKAPGVKRQ